MTQLRPTIDKAGSFPVVQIPCPFNHGFMADLSKPRAGILHTTEGPWNSDMAVFRVHYAPHFLVGLNAEGKAEIAQLMAVGYGALACKEHNNGAVIEIEMVAYSQEKPWLPDPATVDALASLLNVCRDEYGIPLSRPWVDGDYGRAGHNPHRSSGKFGTTAGWFGHGDMPDPDTHWDPGNLRWSDLFARAHELAGPRVTINSGPATQVHAPISSTVPDGPAGVKWLQSNLVRLGTPLAVDGVMGPKTQTALREWQAAHGLVGSGWPSPVTVAALQKAAQAAGVTVGSPS